MVGILSRYLVDDLESQISIFIVDNFAREDVRKIIVKIIQGCHGHGGGSLEKPVQAVAEIVVDMIVDVDKHEECQVEVNTDTDWAATDQSIAADWS